MFSIKEVSEIFHINANKLRFYEKKGLITPRRNEQSGYREYSEKNLLEIKLILTYRALDISIIDIKKIMIDNKHITLEEQLFKQLKIINSKIYKYRTIQIGLEHIMNLYLEEPSTEQLNHNFIHLGSSIKNEEQLDLNWVDLWNFDNLANSYDDLILNDLSQPIFYNNYEKLLNQVYDLSCVNLKSDALILEIGVGTGNLASMFLNDGIDIIGLDQSVNMMFEAKRKYPDLILKYGEFLKLPFENKHFDKVVSTYAFHHLTSKEKKAALIEMSRVLKVGGEIIIGDIMIANDIIPSQLILEDEYYTKINEFIKIANLLDFEVSVTQIDEFLYILKIKLA